MELSAINKIDVIILSLSGIFFLIQATYYIVLYYKIYKQSTPKSTSKKIYTESLPPLSVIISARNQGHNLQKYLPIILEQDYPLFEVIVINDNSTDNSKEVLSVLGEKYPHLYHSFTPESARYISHKKLSITLGIKASKYDWLVFTEANCYPISKDWLKLMARNFTPDTEIVLGYNKYEYSKGWLNKRISFDTLFTALRYLSFAIVNKPFMGIGRNMAYRKELFFKHKGFSAYLNMLRGDDDLFINQIATSKNTKVETNSQAVTCLQHSTSSKEWKDDKINYVATSEMFKGMQKIILGFETTSRLLLYATITGGIVYEVFLKNWLFAGALLGVWLLRFLIQLIVINNTAKTLGEKRRYYFSLPVFDLLLPLQSLLFKIDKYSHSKYEFLRR